MDEQLRRSVREAIHKRLASFEAAERALDAPALLAHFRHTDEFYMHNDGHRIGYDAMAAAVSQSFPTLRGLEGGFSGLEIHVLTADTVLVTAQFRETITLGDGAEVRQRGAATWLWRLHSGEWRIAYGHVDHYPDSEA